MTNYHEDQRLTFCFERMRNGKAPTYRAGSAAILIGSYLRPSAQLGPRYRPLLANPVL